MNFKKVLLLYCFCVLSLFGLFWLFFSPRLSNLGFTFLLSPATDTDMVAQSQTAAMFLKLYIFFNCSASDSDFLLF